MPAVAALLVLAPAILGCGGAPSPGVAHLSSGKGTGDGSSASAQSAGPSPESTTSHQQREVAYAKCLRSHGVPGVREPSDDDSIVNGLGGSGPNPGPPQFHAAQRACNDLLPPGRGPTPQMQEQATERALTFAVCMHSHGEPSFPEPSGTSGYVRIGPGTGIEQGSPQFTTAAKACRQYFGPPGAKRGVDP